VFEHLNRLQDRGHSVALYSGGGQPDWFDLRAPVHTFDTYPELAEALAGEEGIKVATWWATAPWVWRASVTRGIPAYFVQDVETSYFPGNERMRNRVLASYREEFHYLTISRWNQERLAEMGRESRLVPPGVDLDNFRPLEGTTRDDIVLAIGRALPLKDLPLTVKAWKRLEPRPELRMFGTEPHLGEKYGVSYVTEPSDAGVNELMNQAKVFVQTSRHEGFCLPLLEAMAAGTPVVSTDAHGNRDFCRDGENCLMVDANPAAVAAGLRRVLDDGDLRGRLVEEGSRTAREYSWDRRIDEVERAFEEIAAGPAPAPTAPPRSAAPRG
jgi:glycosyltransferase involved in cell wall biosynthesis